ncbi:MAG: hypothetical protein AABY28_00015 [Candidatus Omnitrophota bacterium]
MDKKDIYEHLAKIYLDASSNKKKKPALKPRTFKSLFIITFVFIIVLSAVSLRLFQRKSAPNSEIALVLLSDSAKINFHFEPAKKEIFSINLNKLNLARYKALGFAVKKANYQDTISLRVEFTNAFKERAELYFKDISHKWHDYIINLSEFKNVNDWSEMANLSFTVEEWNVKKKTGLVFVDNVRLLK